jgi:hypothetical protein
MPMTRSYTILATNGELLTSPYINNLKQTFDLVLNVGEPEIVNFLFQFPISRSEAKTVSAIYNKNDLDIADLYVDCFNHQTLITTTLTAKEIGSLTIAFALPLPDTKSENANSKQKLPLVL